MLLIYFSQNEHFWNGVRDDIQFANKGGGGCGDGCLDLSATVSLRKAWERQTLLGATNLRLREFVDDH